LAAPELKILALTITLNGQAAFLQKEAEICGASSWYVSISCRNLLTVVGLKLWLGAPARRRFGFFAAVRH
jgi:hypothetical protein